MERFVPCQITNTVNCEGCVFSESSRNSLKESDFNILNRDSRAFTKKDNKTPLDAIGHEGKLIVNLCTAVTGRKYIHNPTSFPTNGEFIISALDNKRGEVPTLYLPVRIRRI